MSSKKACYRKLTYYQYQLKEDYLIKINLANPLSEDLSHPFFELKTDGTFLIKAKYAWDGPSGITVDTKTFMRGSLVHDALYQLMNDSLIQIDNRKYADDLLKIHCKEDGMFAFRAWYVHLGVRLFGEKYAKPITPKEAEIICVP